MIDNHDQDFHTLALDPILLNKSFEKKTNWHVITGAPCSGKTTIIDLLARKGFNINLETGRKYVEREITAGKTINEIRSNPALFDEIIKNIQLETESNLNPNDVLFLDRAFPDSLSFFRLHGMNPNLVLKDCFHYQYASVFVLDRFPVKKDMARTEDDITAELLDEWLARDYGALGYGVIRVPVLPPEDRMAFILERRLEGLKAKKAAPVNH